MSIWKTIDSAPMDGTAVLVMRDIWPGNDSGRADSCNGHNTYVAAWWASEGSDGTGRWVCYMDAVHDPVCPIVPTHWAPLPPAPGTTPAPRKPLTEDEKDAARWRFLVDNSFDKDGVTQFHVWEHSWEPHSQTDEPTEWKQRVRGPALNRFVDRAIEAAHGIKEQEHE